MEDHKKTMHQCLISLLQSMVNVHKYTPNLSKVILRDNTNTRTHLSGISLFRNYTNHSECANLCKDWILLCFYPSSGEWTNSSTSVSQIANRSRGATNFIESKICADLHQSRPVKWFTTRISLLPQFSMKFYCNMFAIVCVMFLTNKPTDRQTKTSKFENIISMLEIICTGALVIYLISSPMQVRAWPMNLLSAFKSVQSILWNHYGIYIRCLHNLQKGPQGFRQR